MDECTALTGGKLTIATGRGGAAVCVYIPLGTPGRF